MSSASSEASAAQLSSGYGADMWLDIKLPPMMKLWQVGEGGSNFFVSEHDARESMGAHLGSDEHVVARGLVRLAKSQANGPVSLRGGVREFVVDVATNAAIGVCLSNPSLGSGSVIQYFVPNWERTLSLTGGALRLGD